MHSLEQRLVSEWQDMGTRILADVTARLSALHQHIIPRSSSRSAERDTQTEREKDLEVNFRLATWLCNAGNCNYNYNVHPCARYALNILCKSIL